MTATDRKPEVVENGAASSRATRLLGDRRLPVLVTAALFLAMYGGGLRRYANYGFGEPQVFLNLFIDNGYLLVAAIGATFVIMSGGIDLSVGSMIGFTTMFTAWLVERQGLPLVLVVPLALGVGAFGGFLMGYVIHNFEIQPFIVTLAGLFLFRGLCLVISKESISIGDASVGTLAQTRVPLGVGELSIGALVALAVLGAAYYVLHYTRFGRRVYAVGGNEQSALLMGLPMGGTKIAVYTVSGFCSALAGLLFMLYIQSGDPLHAIGMELDAIAAVVIGGTLLTGGSGYVLGTLFGVLVLGLIKSLITFEGTLSSWWTKIATGVLLCAFILIQRTMTARRKT
ncbi:sugar ABC transporter permease YjfF [Streptomyces sp. YC504]|uniref:Sugar ABC transporter permease YjfF n=1 Tax=Streptomyces mesophilus TaxID=1775132 RepID=A0A6G4XRH5_9ACTN|nr:galactofuranose ABC transporter, permease protein YjfF [Streptomyces mesophilus]NGO79802.1 sugar ABC transporter permease YjfF [Streptomyces mesophilus]